MMNVHKKAATLALILSIMTTSALAAPRNHTSLEDYQEKALHITQQVVADKVISDKAIPQVVTLDENRAVAWILQNNRSIKEANWSYEAAKAGVRVQGAAKNPVVTYQYKASKMQTTDVQPIDTAASHALDIQVPLYTGGKIESALAGARYQREGAQAAVVEAKQAAKLKAVTDYYGLIKARNKINIAQQALRDYEGHLSNVTAQYNVGIVASSDVLASKTRLEKAKTNLVQAQQGADLAEAALNMVLAIPVQVHIDTTDQEMTYRPYEVTLDDAKAYALAHRAILVQSTMQVKAAEEAIHAAKAGKLPAVYLNVGDSFKSQNSLTGTDHHTGWHIAGQASWNLWDGGASDAVVAQRKAMLEQVKEHNLATIDSILLGVQQAYLTMRSTEQMISSTKTAVEEGQENFRIASLRYRAGVGTNIDVLDAETELANARNRYVDALYDYNVSVATLEQAIGIPVETRVANGAALIRSHNM